MPTDEQIKQYADGLPPIYRALLSAFPAVSPDRRAGDGLTTETIQGFVEENYPGERSEDVPDGLNQLEQLRFLESSKKWSFYSPTTLGERLIQAVTGKTPAPKGPPPLPKPVWG